MPTNQHAKETSYHCAVCGKTRAVAQNGVRVIGRTSAAALQAKGLDERAIARELGVSSLLTGRPTLAESMRKAR